jgi:heat induced stress protein YflT
MSSKNTAVFGIFPTHESADAAVDALRTKGFRNTDVSVLFPQNVGSKEFGHEKGTKSAEGAVAGGGTGAVIGGTTGALIGLGLPEYQAKRYEGRMRNGGILLSVHADDQEWANKGKQILEQTGAEDIASTGETKGDFGNTDRPTRVEHVAPVAVVEH